MSLEPRLWSVSFDNVQKPFGCFCQDISTEAFGKNNQFVRLTDRLCEKWWRAPVLEPAGCEMLTHPLCSCSLQCRCHPGFQLKRDGKTCVDIDECTTTYPCSQRCINTHGSFHCLCVDGFELNPNDPTICKSTSGKARVCMFCIKQVAHSQFNPEAFVFSLLVSVCRGGAIFDLC